MQHLPLLGQLIEAHGKANQRIFQQDQISMDFLSQSAPPDFRLLRLRASAVIHKISRLGKLEPIDLQNKDCIA